MPSVYRQLFSVYYSRLFICVLLLTAFFGLFQLGMFLVTAQENTTRRVPEFYYSSDRERRQGGVLTYSSTEEPTLSVNTYQKDNQTMKATFGLFTVPTEYVVQYLTHNEDGNQLKVPSTQNLAPVASFENILSNGKNIINLPVQGSGTWLLEMKIGDQAEYLLVVRSSTGVIVKEYDEKLLVWAQDLGSGRRQSNGQVKSFNLKDGVAVEDTQILRPDGTALLNASANTDIILYESESEVSLIPINLKYFNSDYYYQRFSVSKAEPKVYLFTDRPLYKPGDTVYFKAIGRVDDDARYSNLSGGLLLQVYNSDNYETPILEQQISSNKVGSFDGTFTLPEKGTGWYDVVIKSNQQQSESKWTNIINRSIQVEEYRKPEYTLDLASPKKEIVSGENISFEVSGHYFSGQPITGQDVTYSISTQDAYQRIYLEGSDYSFDDYYGYWFGVPLSSGKVTLDEQGSGSIPLSSSQINNFNTPQIFTIEASFTDGSGNPVQRRANVLVHPSAVTVYSETWRQTFDQGQPGILNLITTDIHGNKVGNVETEVTFAHSDWSKNAQGKYQEVNQSLQGWTGRSNATGSISLPIDTTYIGSQTLTIKSRDDQGRVEEKKLYLWVSDGKSFNESGAFEEPLNIKTDKTTYQPNESVSMQISSRQTGRDALLTFERGRVDRYSVISLDNPVTAMILPLESDDLPNMTIKVSSFANNIFQSTGQDILVSAEGKRLQVGVASDREQYGPGDTVTLDITTLNNEGNGTPAEVTVWAVDKAIFELSTSYVSDIFDFFWSKRWSSTMTAHSLEGINVYASEMGGCFLGGTLVTMADGKQKPIQDVNIGEYVLTYKSDLDKTLVASKVTDTHAVEQVGYLIINGNLKVTPNHIILLNGRWQEIGNAQQGDVLVNEKGEEIKVVSVEWMATKQQVYNLTIEKYHTYFANGIYVHNDKGDESRSILKDTAYWNPSLRTDAQGKATVRFTLPDDLTTWTIAAVAANASTQVGQTATEIVVSKPVIVRPHVPNLLRIGDEAELSAVVQNFTNSEKKFTVTLESESVQIDQNVQHNVVIPSGQSKEVIWKVNPTQANADATWTFSAQVLDAPATDGFWDSITIPLPIEKFGFSEESISQGQNGQEVSFQIAPDSDKTESYVEVQLATSALGTLPVVMNSLIDYPYGCMEQTTSRFAPVLVAKAYPEFFSSSLKNKNVDEMIAKGVERLQKHQRPDGGWSWWYAGQIDPFVTYYVLEQLLWAKELGYQVPEDMLSRAKNGLLMYETSDQRMLVAKQSALALFDDTKVIVTDFNLETDSDLIALAIKANANNGFTELAQQQVELLLSKAKKQGDTIYWYGGSSNRFGSHAASTALAIRALIAAKASPEQIGPAVQYLTINRGENYWSNTYANANAIIAIAEYGRYSNETAVGLSYEVLLNGTAIASGTVTNPRQMIEPIRIPVNNINQQESKVSITKQGEGQLYSTVVVHQLRTDKEAEALEKGMKLTRKYLVNDVERTVFVPGEEVTVQLEIEGLNSDHMYRFIRDYLPAGMIPINENLDNETKGVTDWFSRTNIEYHIDGVEMAIPNWRSNKSVYTYRARVISPGRYYAPPAQSHLMYNPEISARTKVDVITILPRGSETPGFSKLKNALDISGKALPMYIRVILGIAFLGVLAGLAWWQKIKKNRLDHQTQETKSVSDPPLTPPVDNQQQ